MGAFTRGQRTNWCALRLNRRAFDRGKAALARRTPKPTDYARHGPLRTWQFDARVYFFAMPVNSTSWPHAPTHKLSESGTYFVTAGTYLKVHHFRGTERLRVLHRGLLKLAQKFGWQLEAWAVFSNHYHFVGHSPAGQATAENLSEMLGRLHAKSAGWINGIDNAAGRQVWHNFWETRLTYQRSYLARLNYVHQNPVKHGLTPVANQYPWCSAQWFERNASAAKVNSIYRFKTEGVQVLDDFEPK
jgi:putative transposase